jgi:hypothetical protein
MIGIVIAPKAVTLAGALRHDQWRQHRMASAKISHYNRQRQRLGLPSRI